ncbi:MAG: choice-of-anchor L domain-containing protein [Bacteroidia bacterium]
MKKIYTLMLISFIGINSLFAQLIVATSATPSDLVNAIAAGGIAVSNIIYNGDALAASTFQCTGTCNVGISGGMLLTSGHASIAAAPNTGTGQGYDLGLVGDPDLTTLTTGLTYDACVLEFDFIAVSDTAIFNYIFASEEYNDYVGSTFNDVFGFFISGPGITGNQNIALIPGTLTPIAINNVNRVC